MIRNRLLVRILTVSALCVLLIPRSTAPQTPPVASTIGDASLSVFFDCQGRSCDPTTRTFYRTEIDWVNWVNTRESADVHIIMTSEGNASQGQTYQIDFIGIEALADASDQLVYRSLGTDTQQENRDGIANTLAIGLARLSTFAGFRGLVDVTRAEGQGSDPTARVVSAQEVDDPWNLWVFRVGGSGKIEGETSREDLELSWNGSASRTTPTWKISFGGRGDFDRIERELTDTTVISEQSDWSWNNLVAYTLAEHWSVGFNSALSKSPRNNQKFGINFRPGIEWSFFPYEEATRRAFTAFYQIGPQYWRYEEETLLGEIEETRFEESLGFEFAQRQPWGDASVSIEGSHFLHDFGLNRLEMDGNLSFRIFRGLSLTASGKYSVIHDQIFLSAKGASDEEILLELQSQATDREYCLNLGFTYQFGSIFNNVVNNRFPGVGRGGFGFGGGCRGGR